MEDFSTESMSSLQPNVPEKKYIIQYSPSSQMGILIGMSFVGLIIGNILSLIPFLLSGVKPLNIPTAMTDPKYTNIMRWVQVISSLFIFIFPLWMYKRIVKPEKDFLQIRTTTHTKIALLVAFLALASLPVTDLMGTMNQHIPLPKFWSTIFQQLEDNYNSQIVQILRMQSIWDFIVSLFIVALLPAILEEAFFRGGFQNILIRWMKKPFWAILITSLIFSAIHFSFYGFLPRAFLGMLLGYVYYWTKDLKMNIMIHFINNAISVITMYVLMKENKFTPDKMSESLPWYLQMIGVIVFAVLSFIFYKNIQKRKMSNSSI